MLACVAHLKLFSSPDLPSSKLEICPVARKGVERIERRRVEVEVEAIHSSFEGIAICEVRWIDSWYVRICIRHRRSLLYDGSEAVRVLDLNGHLS